MVVDYTGGYCQLHGYYWQGTLCPMCANAAAFIHITTSTSVAKPQERPAGSPAFHALLDELRDLHERKNRGYAGHSDDPFANFRQCETFGISATDGVITRMSDKYSRLQSLWADASNEQVGESVKDTLMDLAAYALILICLMREQNT